jgi:hypothetical protein
MIAALFVAFIAPGLKQATEPATVSHLSAGCISIAANSRDLAAARCVPVEATPITVTPAITPRVAAWLSRDGAQLVLDELPQGASTINIARENSGVASFALTGDAHRGWPSDVTLSITRDAKELWRIILTKQTASNLRTLRLPAGRYTFTATTAHHASVERTNLTITPRHETQLGTLHFRPSVEVTARFIDRDGAPIAGVAIASGDDGRILAIAAGDGSLSAELPSHTPKSLDIIASGYATHHVVIDRTAAVASLGTITLDRGSALRVNIDRNSIAGARIAAALLAPRGTERERRVIATKTLEARSSSFEFPTLEPGDYTLLISGESQLERYAEDVRIRDTDVVLDIHIDPIKVDGEVLLGDSPLADASLSLQPRERGWEETVEIDDHGTFTAQLWQHGTFDCFVFGGKARSGAFVRDALEASASPTHWHIVIPDRRIVGRVFDKETHEALRDASMDERSSTTNGSTGMAVVELADDGSFSIDAADAGEYEFNVHARDYLPATSRITLRADDTIRTLDIPMERGQVAHLLVTTPNGEPIANATVIDGLGTDGVNPDHVYLTDAAGHIDLRMQPDATTTIYVIPREGSFAIADVRAPRDETTAAQRVVVPPSVGDLHIHVTDADGKPLRYVQPIIRFEGHFLAPPVPRFFPFADPRYAGVATDEQGSLTFKAFPAGVYEIYTARSANELLATLRGTPARDPVRTGFTGSAEVRIIIP